VLLKFVEVGNVTQCPAVLPHSRGDRPDRQGRVPKGNRYILLRDTFGPLFHNPDFQHLFSHTGQPGEDPARLALITILQFVERLSDERTADAVRSRIDWKYLLALPLTDAGFDASVLSEFRSRLVDGNAEYLLFDTLLTQFREQGLLRTRGRQRSNSIHVLAAVRALNRLRLFSAICAPDAPPWLRTVPAIEALRRVWVQNYTWADDATLRWRTNEEALPAGQYIRSPQKVTGK
jgi:transposase